MSNSEAFVSIATAGRHSGLSAIYIRHNLFHQNKLGLDVQLQHKPIVPFKSPSDVMQSQTLSAKLIFGSELIVEMQRRFSTVIY